MKIRKEEVKLSPFGDNMNAYIENPKTSTKELLILIRVFIKTVRLKITKSSFVQ